MKIGILDGYTLFQSDLSWKELDSFGEVIYQDRKGPDGIHSALLEAEVLITNKFVLDGHNIPSFPHLKLIIVSATGYNCVDLSVCQSRNIQVCNVPNYGTFSVAQHALALLLDYSNGVAVHADAVSNGEWVNSKDWCFQKSTIIELMHKKMGIIGMGAIGKAFANMCLSLGMQVSYSHTKDLNLPNMVFRSLEDLAKESDFISLHCPLTPQTNHLIDKFFLANAKKNLVVINTSRGGLIHAQDLADALNNGQIAAALLDVLEVEPPAANNPLLSAKNTRITPHNAWISFEARSRIFETVKLIVENYSKQQPLPNKLIF